MAGGSTAAKRNFLSFSWKVKQPLARGTSYIWKVEARGEGGDALSEGVSNIEVLPEAKSNALNAARAEFDAAKKKSPDDASAYVLMSARYAQEGLTWEAIGVLEELAQKQAASPYPHERLASLYHSLGLEAAAHEHEKKAQQLSK